MIKTKPDFKIKVELYLQEVLVFTDSNKALKWFSENSLEPDDDIQTLTGAALHHLNLKEVNFFIVYLPKGSSTFTIAHEFLHIAWDILENAGVKVDHDNHEALAYLLSFLVTKYEKRIK